MSVGTPTIASATEAASPPDPPGDILPRRRRSGPSREERGPRRFDPWLYSALTVAAGLLVVALVAAIQQEQVLGFGDSVSHVLIPTRVFRGYDVGFRQLGVHWLPLGHVLELPFAWLAPLYREGISGVIPSIACSLLTAFYLYRLARLVGAPGSTAFLATLMLVANPNFLFMGVVPMLAATIMASTTANIYYLTRWALTPERTGLLVAAGLTLSLATLSHIDTWPLVPLELLTVVILVHRRWRSGVRTVASSSLALLVGAYGIVTYLLMNVLIFGDPFAFLGSGVERGKGAEGLFRPLFGLRGAVGHPWAVWENAGPALGVVGLLGTVVYVWRRCSQPRLLVPLLLFYPFVWYVFQAYTLGSFIIPSNDLSRFVHVRYAVTVLPALAFFGAVGLGRRWLAALATVAVLAGSWVMVDQGMVATWLDAKSEEGGVINHALRPVARSLGDGMGDGLVYMPVVEQYNDRFVLLTGKPPSRFVDANASAWRHLRLKPLLARELGADYLLKVGFSDPARFDGAVQATGAKLCVSLPQARTVPAIQIYTLIGTCPGGETPRAPVKSPARKPTR